MADGLGSWSVKADEEGAVWKREEDEGGEEGGVASEVGFVCLLLGGRLDGWWWYCVFCFRRGFRGYVRHLGHEGVIVGLIVIQLAWT